MTRLLALFNEGGAKLLDNCMPIAVVLILMKLFSKALLARISTKLDAYQPVDQTGFTLGFSRDGHMFVMTMLAEKCTEHNLPNWVAAAGFKKAHDCAGYGYFFEVLEEASVPSVCTHT